MSKQTRLISLPDKKPRSRKAMIEFLTSHFRYNTENSWNRGSSYAVKIKVDRLNLTQEQRKRCYEALEAQDCLDESGFNFALQEFGQKHNYYWQIGTNGRSGGYAVLYKGSKVESEYKSRCTLCRQLNYTEATEKNCKCGKCGNDTRRNLTSKIYDISTSGEGVDEEQDYEDWDIDTLRSRVNLVWEFGETVEKACREFVDWAESHKVEERTIRVPKTIKVAVPR